MPQDTQNQPEQAPAPAMEAERERDVRKLAKFLNDAEWDFQYFTYLLGVASESGLIRFKDFKMKAGKEA